MASPIRARVGLALARYLTRPRAGPGLLRPDARGRLAAVLRPADVLLVEGRSRVSTGIKYLTQSTWSHAALYAGPEPGGGEPEFIEADTVQGVRRVPLSHFDGMATRICRPIGLDATAARQVVAYCAARIGQRYDLGHVFDLARYLLPTPPVPVRWRRRLISLGSGDPTRAICSTLIAQAFQSVRYPILPMVEHRLLGDPDCPACTEEILHLRHHTLFVPRDFDLSPYFAIVKPTLDHPDEHFDPAALRWSDRRSP